MPIPVKTEVVKCFSKPQFKVKNFKLKAFEVRLELCVILCASSNFETPSDTLSNLSKFVYIVFFFFFDKYVNFITKDNDTRDTFRA